MINQRVFLNVLDENQKPISRCRVRIENKREKYEADTDFSGIVEFLVPLGVYVLTLEHILFKKKAYRMTLSEGFSFTRIVLQRNSFRNEGKNKIPISEYVKNTKEDYNIRDVINEKLESQRNKKNLNIDEEVSVNTQANSDLGVKTNDEYKIETQDNIKVTREYFKNSDLLKDNGIWETAGVFEGLNGDSFEEIIKGARAILNDILDFASSIEDEEKYETQEDDINYGREGNKYSKLSDNYSNKRKKVNFDDLWESKEIKGLDKNYDEDTFDVYDYEEVFDKKE
ncbi:hypothetical protein FHH43_09615 [Clostridium perfringens]|nr:hypothetical protein [Clostridium perfringens]